MPRWRSDVERCRGISAASSIHDGSEVIRLGVGVDHRAADISMSHQRLRLVQLRSALEQVRAEMMPQAVRRLRRETDTDVEIAHDSEGRR